MAVRTWELALDVEPGPADEPVFRRIARVVARDIGRGRLRPGERLSSTRTLAESLGVNRNTVVAAFDELRRQGWVDGRSTRGTFVATTLPSAASQPVAPPEPGFDLPPEGPGQRPAARHPDVLLLLGGVPDLRLLPARELARAYGRALRGRLGRRAVDYGDPQGSERLRTQLAALGSRTRGLRATADGICVVRGSQQGLYLLAKTLISPGDVVAVEAVGYPPGWQAMRMAGAELAPIPVDRHGIDVDALEALCAVRRVRAVLVTPHHQYPTTVTLSPERRRRLLALAARLRILVIEDDYDFEYHYDGPPVLPLAADDPAAVVVYVATLSKTLAPGLRLGYVVAPPSVIRRVTDTRSWVDQQGDHVVEHAVAQLLEDGDLQRHTRRVRRIYLARRNTLVAALRERLPDLEVDPPSGGMAVWARAPGLDTTQWAARGRAAGVVFQAGGPLTFGGAPTSFLRLGFAACTEAELRTAVERLASTRPDL